MEIIANLRNNYDPEQLLQANTYLNACKVHPELEGEWWIERDYRSECPVYWRFEPLGADYIAIRQQFDGKTRRMTETRYELFLYQEDADITFVLMRQSAMESLCTGGLIPEEAYMQGICRIDDPDRPTELEWEFRTNRYDDFPTVLTRASGEAEKWSGEMADGTWIVHCETGHYDYMATERVITLQNIYVECDSEPLAEGGRRVTAWYRIPRQGLLTQVGVDSPIVRVRHNDTIYIGFIPQNCFLDVTDETRRHTEGIDIREQIVVHAEEQPTEERAIPVGSATVYSECRKDRFFLQISPPPTRSFYEENDRGIFSAFSCFLPAFSRILRNVRNSAFRGRTHRLRRA